MGRTESLLGRASVPLRGSPHLSHWRDLPLAGAMSLAPSALAGGLTRPGLASVGSDTSLSPVDCHSLSPLAGVSSLQAVPIIVEDTLVGRLPPPVEDMQLHASTLPLAVVQGDEGQAGTQVEVHHPLDVVVLIDYGYPFQLDVVSLL